MVFDSADMVFDAADDMVFDAAADMVFDSADMVFDSADMVFDATDDMVFAAAADMVFDAATDMIFEFAIDIAYSKHSTMTSPTASIRQRHRLQQAFDNIITTIRPPCDSTDHDMQELYLVPSHATYMTTTSRRISD
jgi:hypothetical protein